MCCSHYPSLKIQHGVIDLTLSLFCFLLKEFYKWISPALFLLMVLCFLMSSLAAGQGDLAERTWALETAGPWFIFWFCFLLTGWPWVSSLVLLSQCLHSSNDFHHLSLLMGLRETWHIYHPAPPFTSLIAECWKDMAVKGALGQLWLSLLQS